MPSPTTDPAGQGTRSPDQAYLIGPERYATSSPGFADAVARAHGERRRPRCLCQQDGVEMYIARLTSPNEGFIVKRMPETGHLHAPDCPSYEPPAELSGLGQVLGTAIFEDSVTGETTLKLDFPLSKVPGRSLMPPAGGNSDSVKAGGSKLSLQGLLHYLWDQAELTHWQPGFAGKRSWATVRRHLRIAAENKFARGDPLYIRLCIPESFSVEQREAINARRQAHWSRAFPRPGWPAQRMILIGEVKEIMPARYGFRAVIKHLPDQPFALDGHLYRRMERRFEAELSLWGSNESLHLITIATFTLSQAGVPSIDELSLMPVTNQWLSVDDAFDLQLTERLVSEGRAFIKPLRYNLPRTAYLPTALLTDTLYPPTRLAIDRGTHRDAHEGLGAVDGTSECNSSTWCWRPDEQAMPTLPPKQQVRGCTPGPPAMTTSLPTFSSTQRNRPS